MAIISKPPPKWTKILSGTMMLNFTGDEREGLTSREKAVIFGFLIALVCVMTLMTQFRKSIDTYLIIILNA